MDNLKEFSEDEIVKMIKENKVLVSDLVDSGICPTCFDKRNNHILYGDNKDKMLYENEKIVKKFIYLCTMCDEPMNHFRVQLIPRYSFEKEVQKTL